MTIEANQSLSKLPGSNGDIILAPDGDGILISKETLVFLATHSHRQS
jgi:hypothetical protein